ncbi:DNA primase [uncultured Amphritea sp.]|uniref:DNA primase n=1 Tax=uncultured Amphritea sp. TaxID=981605 RepID=UPI002631BD8F|nr:DNA primase [uncultured Amphritea sp.]
METTNSSGMIPQDFIDDLAAKVNLVDFMTEKYGTKFKVVGSNAVASCPSPSHPDKSPSFSVSTAKNLCNCHSCGFGGNIFKVVEQLENVSFPEAVKVVANHAGFDVPGTFKTSSSTGRRDVLRSMLESARDTFRSNYKQNENPEINRMISDRGFTPEMVNKFQLGVALASWNQITNQFGNYNRAQLLSDSGLSVYQPKESEDGKNKLYDRFRDALIFPIRDTSGSTISFGARFKDGVKPKYINGIETELFKKHRVMYGLYETIQTERKRDKIAVVEGYTDVISMHQAGLDYATAPMGTALTDDQIRLLLRHTNDLVFCFDSDRAGKIAAQKALNTVLPFINDERKFSFCHLPSGHDPDSLLKQFGAKAMETTLEQSKPLSRYIIDTLFDGRPTNNRESLAKIGLQFSDMLNQIPASLFKSDLIKQFEQLTGIELAGALNVEFSTDSAQPHQLIELSDTIRRVTSSQLKVEPNKINVRINSDCVRPAGLNSIFVNQSSVLQQSLPAGSSDVAYIKFMNTAAEHIIQNLSLSIKDISGIPLNQLIVDAGAAASPNPAINRLSALATSQLKNVLINNDLPHMLRLLASEINRVADMNNFLAKKKSPQCQASEALCAQITKCGDRSIRYVLKLSEHSPSNSYHARYNQSAQMLHAALERLGEHHNSVRSHTAQQISPSM